MPPTRLLWICGTSHPEPLSSETFAGIIDRQTPTGAIDRLRHVPYDVVLLDGISGVFQPATLIKQIQALAGSAIVLARGVPASLHDRLLEIDATILDREDPLERIRVLLERRSQESLVRLAEEVSDDGWERLLVGDSEPIRSVRHTIRMVGARRATVLISGETGTGKEIAAKALHQAGPRRRHPFVAVNCSALPDNLMEAELFGHVRGAFTGAVQNRVGRFEQAQGGTLFLDEIGEMPLELQSKLLRVLQEREFQKLGSSETIKADVRIVAATNRNLLRQVELGLFREDLYYRLNVVPLQMPPLRQRQDDVPVLARYFVGKICGLEEIPVKQFEANALDRLVRYSWPGNVRQLENAVEMAVAMSGPRKLLIMGDFSLPAEGPRLVTPPVVAVPDQGLDFEQTVAFIERSILEQALQKTGGNKKAAADMLGLKRTTLSAKVRSLDPEAACS